MNSIILKSCVYVLQLENDKWYIGQTHNMNLRFSQHISNQGARWTKLHKPIDCIRTSFLITEREMTLEYMRLYGWENVRGAGWCSIDMDKPPAELKNHLDI